MNNSEFQVPPPPGPPSFLGEDDLLRLCKQGYLVLELPNELTKASDAFFTAAETFFDLSEARKTELYPPVPDNTERGYYFVAAEKEFVTFRCSSIDRDQDPPEIEIQLGPLWHDLAHLLYRILVDLGKFLHIDEEAWQPLVSRSLTLPVAKSHVTPSLLRVFRYEPHSGIADPHNDLGLLTLCICRGAGLQVRERSNTSGQQATKADEGPQHREPRQNGSEDGWGDAGAVTLLVGDTLRVLSSRRAHAGRHRVVSNPSGRSSIVFALRMSTDTTLDLPLFGGKGKVSAKLLWERIKENRVNVNAQKEVRDQQRQQRS